MALKDLIAQKSAITEEAIEQIVSDYIWYDPAEREVAFKPDFAALSNRAKVLVYLSALQGWQFVMSENAPPAEAKPAELGEKLGIPGGSLRPVLKELKDGHLVASKQEGYSVRAANLASVRQAVRRGSDAPPASVPKVRRKAARSKRPPAEASESDRSERPATAASPRRRSGSGEAASKFSGWLDQGFFDHPRTLADVQARFHEEAVIIPQTSIPRYLLGAVRGQRLARTKEERNGRQVWVYRTKAA